MLLNNPITLFNDSVFPGENWFFYFKTSASLWKSKLESVSRGHLILVPIFWSLHVDTPDYFDFGKKIPETNLAKLFNIAQELGKQIVFVVPLGPFPFLPNGGIPPSLARTLSLGLDSKANILIDSEGKLIKLYSFFDPRLYHAYKNFLQSLTKYFADQSINPNIIGAINGYSFNGEFRSYLEDYSQSFDHGFERYLKVLKANSDGKNLEVLSPDEEIKHKYNYIKMVDDLYSNTAKEVFGTNWCGAVKFSYLGGSSSDFITRSFDYGNKNIDYVENLLQAITLGVVPSSALLPIETKKGVLVRVFDELINSSYLENKIENKIYENEHQTGFSPLIFFEIYKNPILKMKRIHIWEKLGLTNFLSKKYRWTYNFIESLEAWNSYDAFSTRVHFISGYELSRKDFQIVLRLFTNGATILFDKSGLDVELQRKLDSFILENNISPEKINYVCPISLIRLVLVN